MNHKRPSQGELAPWLSSSPTDPDAQEATALLRAALAQDSAPLPPAIGARMRKRLEKRGPKLLPELKAAIALSAALICAYLIFAPPKSAQPKVSAERTIALANNSVMRLDAQSKAQHRGLQVNLQHGRAQLEVPALPAERKLQLRAGETTVESRDASFAVHHQAPRTQVWVQRGAVQISRLSAVHKVRAGQHWDSAAHQQARKPQAPKHAEHLKAPALQAPVSQAPVPRAASPRPARAVPNRKPEISSPPPGSSPRFSAPPTRSQQSQLERAARATQAGQLRLAQQIYTELAKTEGRAAVLALYLHARILSERPEAALRLLEQIRAPRDPLAPEIELARIEAMLALGRCQQAQQRGEQFSRRRPERASMLRSLPNVDCPKFFEQRSRKDH